MSNEKIPTENCNLVHAMRLVANILMALDRLSKIFFFGSRFE